MSPREEVIFWLVKAGYADNKFKFGAQGKQEATVFV